jgi:SAM-dependent methyltransferase
LDDQIPFGTRIIECGCGTGQLTNFLSIAGRTVIGADMCMNSLRMAQGFKERNGLKRAHFFQMNLFRPCFRPGQFDLVISNGVLHHTADPFLAFRTISKLVKPGGYILIGLYHKYGRLTTDIRRGLLRLTRDRLNLDRRMSENISDARKRSWYMDQYKNPHESKHTISEVLGWLQQTGFTFVKSIPKTVPFESFSASEKLFAQDELGSWLSRSIVELGMAVTACRDGGLFIVIARKSS